MRFGHIGVSLRPGAGEGLSQKPRRIRSYSERIQKEPTRLMMREIVCASLMVFTSGGALGQASAVSTAFEVASVKTNQTSRGGGEGSERENIASSPGSLTMLNVSLRSCILWAYRVRTYQISGPAWLSSDRYDIVAKTSSPGADEQLRLML